MDVEYTYLTSDLAMYVPIFSASDLNENAINFTSPRGVASIDEYYIIALDIWGNGNC